MSVTLDLKPELEAPAQAGAAASGIRIETYLENILEQAPLTPRLPPARQIPLDEFDAVMDALAEGSDNIPPPAIVTRADIYADHD